MNWEEKLFHYQLNNIDRIKDEELLEEAIATCENFFPLVENEKLMHHSRILAISYLALKYQQRNNMQLKDIKTLKEIHEEYGIKITTLKYRLKKLEENVDYKSMGRGQGTILTLGGVEKIVQGKEKIKRDNKTDIKEDIQKWNNQSNLIESLILDLDSFD